MLAALGKLWTSGVRVPWSEFSRGESRRRVSLPAYPFERQKFWVAPSNPATSRPQPPSVRWLRRSLLR
jgi:phthiocerol/phenolphthiocerol synthesis type-I polyketide synthase E